MDSLISPADLHDLLARAQPVTLVDVRPREAFLSGHIPGAVSIPRAELERRLGDIPPGRPVVTY